MYRKILKDYYFIRFEFNDSGEGKYFIYTYCRCRRYTQRQMWDKVKAGEKHIFTGSANNIREFLGICKKHNLHTGHTDRLIDYKYIEKHCKNKANS